MAGHVRSCTAGLRLRCPDFRYALVLFENQNLRQLFNIQRQPLRIVRGKVSMQNNRMLCYSKIDAFLGHIGQRESVTENDVSKYSNGDKAICKGTLSETRSNGCT